MEMISQLLKFVWSRNAKLCCNIVVDVVMPYSSLSTICARLLNHSLKNIQFYLSFQIYLMSQSLRFGGRKGPDKPGVKMLSSWTP